MRRSSKRVAPRACRGGWGLVMGEEEGGPPVLPATGAAGSAAWGPYRILGRVGRGAFGEVLRAVHEPSGAVLALKRVLLRRPEDGLPDNLLREIKVRRDMVNWLPNWHGFPKPSMVQCATQGTAPVAGPATMMALELAG